MHRERLVDGGICVWWWCSEWWHACAVVVWVAGFCAFPICWWLNLGHGFVGFICVCVWYEFVGLIWFSDLWWWWLMWVCGGGGGCCCYCYYYYFKSELWRLILGHGFVGFIWVCVWYGFVGFIWFFNLRWWWWLRWVCGGGGCCYYYFFKIRVVVVDFGSWVYGFHMVFRSMVVAIEVGLWWWWLLLLLWLFYYYYYYYLNQSYGWQCR